MMNTGAIIFTPGVLEAANRGPRRRLWLAEGKIPERRSRSPIGLGFRRHTHHGQTI
jgi:hypothetical protein